MINTRIGHANKSSARSSTNVTNGCAIVETKYIELIIKSSKGFSTKNLALKNQILQNNYDTLTMQVYCYKQTNVLSTLLFYQKLRLL